MKRLISLILALIIVISSVSVFAREYYSGYDFMDDILKFDINDLLTGDSSAAEEEIDEEVKIMTLLETLGIWDDASISKDELLSMQEFSKVMSKVKLGTGNAFESIYDFNPTEEYATYNHAYTYLVEALGYSYKCRQYAGAEDANIIVAAEIGLLKEKPQNINSYITRGELAALIYKAINMDLCVIEYPAEGGTRHTVIEGKTLLNSVHNIFVKEGFVNGVPGINLYGTEKIRNGYFQINRQNIKNIGMDLTEYLGRNVQAYTRYDDSVEEYTLLAIYIEEKVEAFEIDFRDINYINSYEIGYIDENGNETVYSMPNFNYIVENGEQLESINDICDYTKNEGVIRFAASTDSREIDTAIISKYNYYVVNNIDTRLSRVVLRYHRTHNGLPYIQLDDKSATDVYIGGVKSDFSALVPGSIIKVLQCSSTGYVRIDALNQNEVSGAPEILYDNTVVVGGKEYRLAKDWEVFVQEKKNDTSIISSQRPKELELGVNTTFYIIDDIIAAYTSSQSYMYGYIKSVTKARTTIDPDITFRIFNQDGEWDNYKVTGDIEFEGQPNVSKETLLDTINSDDRIADFFDHPIRFRVNGENEILALDTIYESQYELESDEDIIFTQYLGMGKDWTNEHLGVDIPFFLSDNTVILVCPNGSEDEDDYKSISNTQMPSANGAIMVPTKIYNINEYRQVSLVVMTQKLGSTGTEGSCFYIQKITQAIIDPDNQIYGYKVYGKEFRSNGRANGFIRDAYFYADEKSLNKNAKDEEYNPDNVIEEGDFIQATVSGTDLISWSMELKGGIVPEPTPADDGVPDRTKTSSYSYVANGKFVRADALTGIWVAESDGIEWPTIPTVKAIINPTTREVIEATVSDFFEGDNVHFNATYGRGKFFIKNEF